MSDTGIHIKSYDSGRQPDDGIGMTTAEMQAEYEVLYFMAPFVLVRRRSDNARGRLEFPQPTGVFQLRTRRVVQGVQPG